jgi:holo-[acyl-carrier protein] synthase
MLRCGVDIIEIERVARLWKKKPETLLARIFTEDEARLLRGYANPVRHLAVRFAAKEAVFKLLGAGIGVLSWQDVEILREPGGAPMVRLHGRAAHRAARLGIGHIALSLSHSRDYAVAQAVAEAGNVTIK